MSRYFFDIENGHRLIDRSFIDCRDDKDTIDQATIIAAQIAADAPGNSRGQQVAVRNDQRKEIGKVPVQQRTIESALRALREADVRDAKQ